MKKLIVLLFVLIFNSNLFSQFSYNWVKALTNSGLVGSRIRGIEAAANGNVYIIGNFNTTTDFDPSSASYFLSPNNTNSCFLAKYAANGNFIWAKEILAETGGGNNIKHVNDLVIDANENIYLTGTYADIVDFDPSPATYTLSSFNLAIYTAKYNSNGSLVWVKDIKKSLNNGVGKTIALDNNNNIYVSGTLSANSFFCKYNNSGTMLWKDSLKSSNNGTNFLNSMHVNSNGEVFIGGNFSTDIDMDPSTGVSQLSAVEAVYLGKYTTNGTLVWAKKLNKNLPFDRFINDIVTDASGNIYSCGIGSIGTDYKHQITKWDINGNLQWMNYFGVGIFSNSCFDISIACNNNLVVSGITSQSISQFENFDPLSGTYTCSPSSNPSLDAGIFAFVASYSSINGSINWAKCLGGPLNYNLADSYAAINDYLYLSNSFIDNNGAVYLCGRIIDNASTNGTTNDFDPNPASTATLNLTTDKAFFAKYTGCAAVGIEEYNAFPKITVFPNPSSNVFTFSGLVGETTIEVYDVSGRLIKTGFCSEENYKLNLSGYNSGVYFYKIKNKHNGLQQGKLLLQ